jgi:murein DD-endopeptidase MepM/ murein hydrolase activator NlpD
MDDKSTWLGWALGGLIVALVGLGIEYSYMKPPTSEETVESREPTPSVETPVVPPITSPIKQASLKMINDAQGQWVLLDDLLQETGGEIIGLDPMEGTVAFRIIGRTVKLLRGTPMLEVDGWYWPSAMEWVWEEDERRLLLPTNDPSFWRALQIDATTQNDTVRIQWDPSIKASNPGSGGKDETGSSERVNWEQLSPQEMADYLSFLDPPIPNAIVSTRDSHLPGARREYRNGYHEGIDWYYDVHGVRFNESTPVIAQAEGIVVRADIDYVEFAPEEREKLLERAHELPHTPQSALDQLRGRSVWVQYDRGVMVRYAHLSGIAEGLRVGDKVKKGDALGWVGNSGTSSALVQDDDSDYHLHMDLLVYGQLFWEPIEGKEVRQVLEAVFGLK